MLERRLVDDNLVVELMGAIQQGLDSEDLSDACNTAFQELETHFVNNVCNGSEQYAWEFIDALAYEATVGKPYDMNFVVGLRHAATVSKDDMFYLKYMGVLLSLYESVNTDVLVANNQYMMSTDTVNMILLNYNEITVTYALGVYLHAKEVFSGFINPFVIPVDNAVNILYRYYQSQNTAGLSIENSIRQALAEADYCKALVYLIMICRANASDVLQYLESVRLNSI